MFLIFSLISKENLTKYTLVGAHTCPRSFSQNEKKGRLFTHLHYSLPFIPVRESGTHDVM